MTGERRDPNPNATIQIDALDPSELVDPGGSSPVLPREPSGAGRRTPPPLPPGMLPGAMGTPPVPAGQAAAPAAPRSSAKTLGMVVFFVVLVAVAIGGGLLVGTRVRGTPAAPSAAASVQAPAAASSASAAPASTTLTIPTIEMNSK